MNSRVSLFSKQISLLDNNMIAQILIRKLTKGLIFLTVLGSLPASANTLNFDQIYLFGDSNSDQGNVFNITNGGFPPEPFFSQGRFTNGKNWVNYLSEDLGLNPGLYTNINPSNPSLPTDGINFTFGGATSGDANLGGSLTGLQKQVDFFGNLLNGNKANPDALYTIWVGPNDYVGAIDPFFGGSVDPNTIPTTAVNNLAQAIENLYDFGAKNILVFNEGNVANTPLGKKVLTTPGAVDFVTSLIDQQNVLLDERVDELSQANPELNLVTFDTEGFFQKILKNPDKVGLTNVTESCTNIDFPELPVGNFETCSNPDEYFFWDNQHLTTAAHKLVADDVLVTLNQEFSDHSKIPEPSVFAGLGLLSLYLVKKKRKA